MGSILCWIYVLWKRVVARIGKQYMAQNVTRKPYDNRVLDKFVRTPDTYSNKGDFN